MVSSLNDISVILFDLDNTLIPTRTADKLACNKVGDILGEDYNVPLERARVICTNYLRTFRECPDSPHTPLHLWRHLLWKQALGNQYNYLTDNIYLKWLHLRYYYLAITPEVTALLTRLRTKYQIGLITNGRSASQWEKIDKLNLKSYFDLILISGDLPWEKPQKQIFIEACLFLGVEPRQCMMVGDKLETDILGGIQAKLGATVWIPLSSEDQASEYYPDYTIEKVADLPSILPKYPNHSVQRPKTYLDRLNRNLDSDDCNSNSSDGV